MEKVKNIINFGALTKCLFSRDVTSGLHAVTRLRSSNHGIVVWSR